MVRFACSQLAPTAPAAPSHWFHWVSLVGSKEIACSIRWRGERGIEGGRVW